MIGITKNHPTYWGRGSLLPLHIGAIKGKKESGEGAACPRGREIFSFPEGNRKVKEAGSSGRNRSRLFLSSFSAPIRSASSLSSSINSRLFTRRNSAKVNSINNTWYSRTVIASERLNLNRFVFSGIKRLTVIGEMLTMLKVIKTTPVVLVALWKAGSAHLKINITAFRQTYKRVTERFIFRGERPGYTYIKHA